MLWFLSALALLTLVSLWVVMLQLIRQQGRMLLRLERVEEVLAQAPAMGTGNGAHAHATAPRGVPEGSSFGEFRLPNLDGQDVGLADFVGRRALLVNWSTDCGYCDLIAPELARLAPKLGQRGVELVLLSFGDAETNRRVAREHGLEKSVLLQREALPEFRGLGTPVAYLLDEEGRVAAPLAVGATEVPQLAEQAAAGRPRLASERSLSDSMIERNGLKAGTPAPVFRLPTLDGGTIALEDFRGRRVLLVFTDPQCGPCDYLGRELVRLPVSRDDDPAIVFVGRGDADENRRKAAQYGIVVPFALQQGWRLSKEYGIFATPVAFLIDERGVIAHDAAIGAEPILSLARTEAAAQAAG